MNFDGYLSDFNFIDGQQLLPTSFGEFKQGIWIPKDTVCTDVRKTIESDIPILYGLYIYTRDKIEGLLFLPLCLCSPSFGVFVPMVRSESPCTSARDTNHSG